MGGGARQCASCRRGSTYFNVVVLKSRPNRAGPADPLYAAWAAQHGRTPAPPAVEARRRAAFHENRRYIEDWNARGSSHNLTLNRFADWTQVRPCFPLPSLLSKGVDGGSVQACDDVSMFLMGHSVSFACEKGFS